MRRDEKLTYYSNDTGLSVEFSADSDYWWADEEGMAVLSNDIKTSQGSNQDGVVVIGKQLAAREITITGQIRGDYATRRAELLRAFNAKSSGRLVYENDTISRYIDCEIKKTPSFERGVLPEFETDFYCASPFWKDGDGTATPQTSISRWIKNLEFPVEFEDDEGFELEYRAPSLVANIVNEGDTTAELTITFSTDVGCDDPKLTSILTQEFILVEYTMLAGDTIRITTGYDKKTAVLIRNGVETNIFNYVSEDSTWLELAIGDNYLRAEASDDDAIVCMIEYDIRYGGV